MSLRPSRFSGPRRVKPVISRPVSPDLALGEPAAGALFPPLPLENSNGHVDKTEDAILPGQRRRRSRQAQRYVLAQIAVVFSLLVTTAGMICASLGDRGPAMVLSAGGLLAGLSGILLACPIGLPRRMLGYALAATILSALAAGASSLFPEAWFQDGAPADLPRFEPKRPTPPPALPRPRQA